MFNCLYCNNPINQFSLQFYFDKYRYELIESYKSKISLKMINDIKHYIFDFSQLHNQSNVNPLQQSFMNIHPNQTLINNNGLNQQQLLNTNLLNLSHMFNTPVGNNLYQGNFGNLQNFGNINQMGNDGPMTPMGNMNLNNMCNMTFQNIPQRNNLNQSMMNQNLTPFNMYQMNMNNNINNPYIHPVNQQFNHPNSNNDMNISRYINTYQEPIREISDSDEVI